VESRCCCISCAKINRIYIDKLLMVNYHRTIFNVLTWQMSIDEVGDSTRLLCLAVRTYGRLFRWKVGEIFSVFRHDPEGSKILGGINFMTCIIEISDRSKAGTAKKHLLIESEFCFRTLPFWKLSETLWSSPVLQIVAIGPECYFSCDQIWTVGS